MPYAVPGPCWVARANSQWLRLSNRTRLVCLTHWVRWVREGCPARLVCHAAVHGACPAYLGSTFTSLSHLASRRVRSAVEPYFLKS
jgi:hypothetical protein